MKNLLKLSILSLVMVCFAFSANAQKKGKKQRIGFVERNQTETAAVAEKLELDEETSTQLLELNRAASEKIDAINTDFRAKKKAGEEVDLEAKKASTRAIWKEANRKIRELLGKEKFKAYQAAAKEMKQARKGKKAKE